MARSITRAATLTSTPSQSARQPLRATGMDTHPHPRFVAVDVDRSQRSLGLEDRTDRDEWVGEHRHDAVTHPLDDVAAGIQQRRFNRARHSPQKLERGVITGAATTTSRNATRSVKTNRDLRVGRAPGHRLGQGLPHLQRAETDLARRAAALA